MGTVYSLWQRIQFGWMLYRWGWRWVVFVVWVLPWTGIAAYDLLKGQGWTPVTWPLLADVIPNWSYLVWILFGIVAFVFVTIEGAYRIVKKERDKSNQAEITISELQDRIAQLNKEKQRSSNDGLDKNALENNMSITLENRDIFEHIHKCSQCGFGFKATILCQNVKCPKCGNID